MEVVLGVQARMSSSRLPGKVMMEIAPGISVIRYINDRLKLCGLVDRVVYLVPSNEEQKPLCEELSSLNAEVSLGSETDVSSRYVSLAKYSNDPDFLVVRVTADCPLIDPQLVDQCVQTYLERECDFLCTGRTFPDGFDVEVFSYSAFMRDRREGKSVDSLEHVTTNMRASTTIRRATVEAEDDFGQVRLTLDYEPDLQVLREVVRHFCGHSFSYKEAADFYISKSEINSLNRCFVDPFFEHWIEERDKKLTMLPYDDMLLSKRGHVILPYRWPSGFETAKGCQITTTDGNSFLDFFTMGVGVCTLGYGHPEVNQAAIAAISKSTNTTISNHHDVELASSLLRLHSWADKAVFMRTGGEANAAAVRLARAVTGRSSIAICGYHGWHDWYLSCVHEKNALDSHLFPGLTSEGIPDALAGSCVPFQMNDVQSFENTVNRHELAAVVMEVERHAEPSSGFLATIRRVCSEKGIVLIFDECTSGFRDQMGGIHLKHQIYPDLAVFGKCMGNGFPITSIIGINSLMIEFKRLFVSSTFWSEGLGPAVARKVLEIYERDGVCVQLREAGSRYKSLISDLAEVNDLEIRTFGLEALPAFTFRDPRSSVLADIFCEQMLRRGILAKCAFYASIAHDEVAFGAFKAAAENVFQILGKVKRDEVDPFSFISGPLASSQLRRFN